MANFELISFTSADELARAAASAWLDEIEAANRADKTHYVALSGGRITQKFFAAAVEQGRAQGVSFANIHFFWADERCLPPNDPESNFKMANELLFTPLKINVEKIHRLRGELPPAEAVEIATEEIRRFAPSGKTNLPLLDLVLLGMGEDGHVASLFPNAGTEVLNCTVPFLAVDNSPKPPPRRISLSYAAIAAARQVWVLASGAGKEKILEASLSVDGSTPLARVIQTRVSQSPTKIYTDLAGIPH
jgi:6-phosphogluconolactonase